MWLVGVVSTRQVWLVGVGVASGCGCVRDRPWTDLLDNYMFSACIILFMYILYFGYLVFGYSVFSLYPVLWLFIQVLMVVLVLLLYYVVMYILGYNVLHNSISCPV